MKEKWKQDREIKILLRGRINNLVTKGSDDKELGGTEDKLKVFSLDWWCHQLRQQKLKRDAGQKKIKDLWTFSEASQWKQGVLHKWCLMLMLSWGWRGWVQRRCVVLTYTRTPVVDPGQIFNRQEQTGDQRYNTQCRRSISTEPCWPLTVADSHVFT